MKSDRESVPVSPRHDSAGCSLPLGVADAVAPPNLAVASHVSFTGRYHPWWGLSRLGCADLLHRRRQHVCPASFAEPDTANLHDFMRRHSFAILTSQGEGGLIASHLPILLDPGPGFDGPCSVTWPRRTPNGDKTTGEVLVIFSGPHAYVSPSWYGQEGTVPTWNYVAVHAYGTFTVVDERASPSGASSAGVSRRTSVPHPTRGRSTNRRIMSRRCSRRSSAFGSRSRSWKGSGSCRRITQRSGAGE